MRACCTVWPCGADSRLRFISSRRRVCVACDWHTHMQVSTLALAICFYCFGARTSSACANCVVCRLTTLVASAEVDDDARWDSAEEAASMASAIVSRALGERSALGGDARARLRPSTSD